MSALYTLGRYTAAPVLRGLWRPWTDGHTGIARIVLEVQVPVVPVAMFGTDRAQPIGTPLPRLGHSGQEYVDRYASRDKSGG